MKDKKNVIVHNNLKLTFLRWTARIWSYIVVAFILLFVGAQIVESGIDADSFSLMEGIAFAFFPIGLTLGLIIAWWKEGLGGIIATISIIAFHLIMLFAHGNPDFVILIELLAVPGPLFIIYWLLSRKKG
ncbi:MAG: hypothetical protein DRH89_01630 [Candidatus Cloacimonadota bacterium]|nr:MAG: hypothetical protein DRH89_01630 [Candidatus Cloacimonadota bacterium]